jgi:hypothetical protein
VEYWSARSYGPTNFAQGVPQTKQLIALASVLLPQLGISLPELSKTRAGHPKFTVFESPMEYRFGDTVVTNVESRSLRFTRALDGVEMYGDGGNGEIEFGGHARVMKISLSWRKVERYKSCITATPSTIVKWLRQGRATYRPADSRPHQAPIDWANVTKITIKSAQPFYWGQIYQSRKSPASLSYIRPYAALLATVETTKEHFDIAIQCPILDENDSRSAAVSHIPFGGSLATF